MGSATRHLIDQFIFARRADKMAARICSRLRRDEELLDLGIWYLRPGEEIQWEEQDGVKVVSTVLGGGVDASRIVDRRAVAGRDVLGFHIEELEDKARGKDRWKVMEDLAVGQFKDVIGARLDRLVEALPPKPFPRMRSDAIRGNIEFGLWLDDRDVRCWIDHQSPYVHVLMRVPFAALVAVPKADAA